MSNDLVAIQNQLPESLRKMLAEQIASDITRLGAAGGKDVIRITQDKKFELPDGTIGEELDVAIVDFVYRNEYYLSAFNKKALVPPACFAISATAADMAPSANSPIKQSDAGCNSCQQNAFGSSPNGDGKACKNTVLLAVTPLDATADTPVWVIKTSPTAIKPFNAYVSKVARTLGVPVQAVATKLFFDPQSSYATLRFDVTGVNPIASDTIARKDEARKRLMEEPDVTKFEMPASKK